MKPAPLVAIVSYARAGALDFAWAQYLAGGYDSRGDDPAALSVKGRLLKDRALLAEGEKRRGLFAEAAGAYAQADAIDPQPYPLINVATLTFLAGDGDRAAALARQVLERLEGEQALAETPYYIEATRA